MLKVNYSDLSHKTREQIYKECARRGIGVYTINKFGRYGEYRDINDLIGEIIAHDAYYEGREDAVNNREPKISSPIKEPDCRKKYCLRCEDADPYYLELTEGQARFLEWAIGQELYLPHAELDEINEVIWMKP